MRGVTSASAVVMPSASTSGLPFEQCAVEVILQSRIDLALCPGGDLDAMLLEEAEGSPTHAAADDDLGAFLVDEVGDISRLMLVKEGVGDGLDLRNLMSLEVDDHIVRAASKVVADGALHSLIGIG